MPPTKPVSDCRTKEALLSLDWSKESQPTSHPLALGVNLTEVFEIATGKVVARIEPGYRFYFTHSHIHMALEGWEGTVDPETESYRARKARNT